MYAHLCASAQNRFIDISEHAWETGFEIPNKAL